MAPASAAAAHVFRRRLRCFAARALASAYASASASVSASALCLICHHRLCDRRMVLCWWFGLLRVIMLCLAQDVSNPVALKAFVQTNFVQLHPGESK